MRLLFLLKQIKGCLSISIFEKKLEKRTWKLACVRLYSLSLFDKYIWQTFQIFNLVF